MTAVTDSKGWLSASYRYDPYGNLSFGKTQYNNIYAYKGESYNPNMEGQYLRARYYDTVTGNFLSEDSYLGDIMEPMSLNRYSYVHNSPLNYRDPSGHFILALCSFIAAMTLADLLILIGMTVTFVYVWVNKEKIAVELASLIKGVGNMAANAVSLAWEGTGWVIHGLDESILQEGSGVVEYRLPTWNKVKVKMNHIISGHTPGGGRGDGNKDKFPPGMTEAAILKAIEEAYKSAEKMGAQQHSWTKEGIEHVSQFFQGKWGNRTIQFYFEYITNTIESAWPK